MVVDILKEGCHSFCCAQLTHYNTKQAGALLEVHIFADHLCGPEAKAFILKIFFLVFSNSSGTSSDLVCSWF